VSHTCTWESYRDLSPLCRLLGACWILRDRDYLGMLTHQSFKLYSYSGNFRTDAHHRLFAVRRRSMLVASWNVHSSRLRPPSQAALLWAVETNEIVKDEFRCQKYFSEKTRRYPAAL
jgi:hypothetical protein